MTKKHFIFLEFLVMCIVVPGIIIFNKWAPFMFAFLWGGALYAFIVYRSRYFKGWKDLWRGSEVNWNNMRPILIRWILASIGMFVFLWLYDPSKLFYIERHNPQIIPYLLILYPVLSAFPQEFIFCSFFFKRYRILFGSGTKMILASALVFAYVHVLYINPVAPPLSFLGGLIFALSFQKTKSLALVTIEHGLYGNSLFLIGLGWYFYSGAVVP